MQLRADPGLPDASVQPPVVAEVGDPFTDLRVVHLLARLPRGSAVRVRDIVDRLNGDYLDWSFSSEVVLATVVQLQANWLTDYRNSDGMVLREGPAGPELVIEDSSRVDPWIVRQADRTRAACDELLRAFAIEEGGPG